MTDSVQDQKVEDMLSSVRRLVSNELPRNHRAQSPRGPSALVLTEAQRVEPMPPMQASRSMTLEERIAELEAAVGGQSDDWEPDGSEDQSEHQPDRIVYRATRPPTEDEKNSPLRLTEIALIETGPANEDEPEQESDDVDVVFESDAAESKTDPAVETHDSFQEVAVEEPDLEPVNEFADAVARDVAAVVAELAETSPIIETDFRAALAEAVRDPADTRGRHEVSEAPIAAVGEESLDGGTAAGDDAAPLDASSDESAVSGDGFSAMTEADFSSENGADGPKPQAPDETIPDHHVGEVPAEEVVELVDATPNEDEAATVDQTSPPQEVVDEDLTTFSVTENELRQMISLMIRHELQGELGERITRNVRKLVRQEVHRALSVRDLE